MVIEDAEDSAPTYKGVVLTLAGIRLGGRRLLPFALFTVPFGIAFGVAAIESGLSSFQAILMSLATFSGAAQFATLDFWTEPLAFGSLAMVVLALNARHTIMGAALAPWINQLPLSRRALVLGYLSDPNFADSQPAFQNGERDIGILLGGGLVLWACWVAGTAIGALGGAELGDPTTFGIDVVMPCFFAAVIAGQPRQVEMIAPILVASAVAVPMLDVLPTGWNVVLAALVGGMVGTLYHAK
ncbi:AzlC family ABC transporter permease [Yoonia sp. F2084L]|uniref:AzlC family ABC transporter permease n=1 Tax=Yoonia sp. F2084L TaxID=2926419 RepID=UPI001FF400ED|nr:AzlC family ABC transporter permease [Yoonia sp. F2084L]MCK0097011.1 AzlC family ABC transporter permease [Yoonia sp. F2084L]